MRRSCAAMVILPAFLALAGCSLVESVIEIEPRGTNPRRAEAGKNVHAKAAYAANAEGTRCDDVFGDGTTTCSDIAKASRAKYDQTRVNKPPSRPVEKKTGDAESGSEITRLFKKWVMTGMRLNSWSNTE